MKLLTLVTGERLSSALRGELFSRLYDAGVRELSFCAFAYEKELFHPGFMDEYLAQARGAGLKFSSAHGIWFHNNDLNWPDRAGRIETAGTQKRYLERAAASGCRTFILHPGALFLHYSEAELWNCLREGIEMLIPAAEANNIVIALENSTPGFLGADCAVLADFIRSFDSPWVGASFDSGCANIAGNVTESFAHLKELVVTAVLHDNNGKSNAHLPPFEGTVPWDKLMPEILSAPRMMHCETDFAKSHECETVIKALEIYKLLPELLL
ncbi:MAG: sugar phosphate isomerase/epimerase [Lentisphaeria bacterium]|nr:sugar phosphate isomerase/epimerase [Lentisphaeria bacterium]